MGAAIIREFVDLESEKQERSERAKKEEKAVREAAAMNVNCLLLFLNNTISLIRNRSN